MIPTYRRDCRSDEERHAWDLLRAQYLRTMWSEASLMSWLWFRFIRRGVLPS